MNSSESDHLSAKLRTWKVEPQIPASFQREVWQRISARGSARTEAFLPQLWALISAQLARPQYGFILVVVSLAAGLGVARVQAQDAKAKQWMALENRYAASIDPLAMNR
jgi:hypothetical protein